MEEGWRRDLGAEGGGEAGDEREQGWERHINTRLCLSAPLGH